MIESMTKTIIELLCDNDINAISAFPNKEFARNNEPTVAVGIKKADIGSAGFGDYLGISSNGEETGFLCTAVVALAVYSPVSDGASGANIATDKIISALLFEQKNALPKLTIGTVEYDAKSRMLKQKCELSATFWIVRTAEAMPELGEFTVKGIITI